MLQGRRPHQNQAPVRRAQARRKIRLIHSSIQWRFAILMGSTCLLLTAAFSFPAWHFVQQNYSIFNEIAFESHPSLIEHLEREQTWIATLLLCGTLITGAVSIFTALRLTTVLLGPLSYLENHMRKVIRGDFSQHEFRVREEDELRELTGTYAYLYRTLRAQTETEIKLLEKLVLDETQIESIQSWVTLMNLKRKQLGLSAIESPVSHASSQDSLRAS